MLIQAHQTEISRYVTYLGADTNLAEDLVQETFLTTFTRSPPPVLSDVGRRAAWLRGIARHLLLRHWEAEKHSPVRLDSAALERAEEAWASTFPRGGDGSAYAEALRECLKQIPRRSREMLDSRYAEGKSRRQMAEVFSLSEDGIKSALQRIRARLSDCVRGRLKLGGSL